MAFDPAAIQIPADLKPADGRFGSGPSKVRPAQVEALASVATTYLGTSHRQKTVRSEVQRLREGIAQLFSLPEGYEVILGNGGSTAFWDVATFGLIEDRAQFLSFGEFGSKFAAAAKEAPHLGDPTIIKSEPGDAPVFAAEAGIDVYATPHNETSTGVAVTPRRVAGADDGALLARRRHLRRRRPRGRHRRDRRVLLRPAEVLRLRRWPVDRCCSARPLSRGSPASRSRAAGRRRSSTCRSRSTTAGSSRRTTRLPLATIFLAAEQTDWFNEQGGLAWCVQRTAESSSTLYTWAEKTDYTTPYVSDPAKRSAVVGTIDFDDSVDATLVAKALRANGIVDVEPYRKLGRNQLRVAMFPAVEPSDVAALTACIDHVVASL